ncbi:hypothetical protein ACFL6I_08675 [candidate division KSB1 bacterium]
MDNNVKFVNNTYLLEEIIKYCTTAPGKIIINTGHFLLYHDPDEDYLVPSILDEIDNQNLEKGISNIFGNFGLDTFYIGVEIMKLPIFKDREIKLTLLINDWQFVEKDETRNPSEPNKYRDSFYNRFKSPPKSYLKVLQKEGIDLEEVWIGDNGDDFFYRETRLRDKFAREIKKLRKLRNVNTERECELYINTITYNIEDNTYYKVMKDGQRYPVIKNGKASCAGEIAILLKELFIKNNSAVVINILPFSCMNPVNSGVEIAFELYPNMRGIAINAFPIDIDKTIDDFALSVYEHIV